MAESFFVGIERVILYDTSEIRSLLIPAREEDTPGSVSEEPLPVPTLQPVLRNTAIAAKASGRRNPWFISLNL